MKSVWMWLIVALIVGYFAGVKYPSLGAGAVSKVQSAL